MLKNVILLSASLFMALPINNVQGEEITNREMKVNSVTLGADFVIATFSPFGVTPFLSLDYTRMINKDFSIGANLKTLVYSNFINLSGRYYFDFLDSKSSEFYIQTDLGYSRSFSPNAPGDTKSYYTNFINLNPTIGYEFRADNGFTFNVDLGPYFTYGIDQDNKGKFSFLPIKTGLKFGYSF